MIQIYNPDNTDFDKNGDMTIFPSSAIVHVILNGSWEADMEHPIDKEERWKYIQEDAVVKLTSFNGDQLFRVKSKEKSDSGITCKMEPIFFDSIGDCFLEDVRPTAKNGHEALNLMTAPNKKYSGKSNITKISTAYYQFKNLMQAINGDDTNSFINRWGGEILFDNFKVIINDRVGGDYGVELRYGKNIPQDGLIEEIDTRDIVTRIYPKAYNGYTMTGNGHVDSPLIDRYPTVKIKTITFGSVKMASDAQDDDRENGVIICNTQEELNTALREKCEEQYASGLDKPKITISADMVLLQNTDLYADYKILEDVSLGDTIHCRHSRLGIVTDARVIELEFDSIRKKVTSVVLGDFQYDYFKNVSSSINKIDQAINQDGSIMAEKISGFINGDMASLRAQYNVAKKQDVLAILFENLDEDSPMYGALAIGTQGILISKERTEDGKSWDWTTAMTANGLMAGIIVAGILSDKTGKNYWNLDTGEFALSSTASTIDGKPTREAINGTVDGKISEYDKSLDQANIFNKLTNNGLTQGVYLKDGRIYINATYIDTGILAGWTIDKANQRIISPNGKIIIDAKNEKITTASSTQGYATDIIPGEIITGNIVAGGRAEIGYGTFGSGFGNSYLDIGDENNGGSSEIQISGCFRASNNSFEVEKPAKLYEQASFSKPPKIFNLTHVSSGGHLVFASDGATLAYLDASSKRYKDIDRDMTDEDVESMYNLPVVWAKYKTGRLSKDDERCGKFMPMFIAEDVDEAFPLAADHKNGQVEDWNYRIMIPLMFQMLKSQKKEIDSLKSEIDHIKSLLKI